MSGVRAIEIVGGGLAGLSLGLALRRRKVPVALFEAGDYPRHRVCGEFIAGLSENTTEFLGLESILADAQRHRRVTWFHRDAAPQEQMLPAPALALSRHALDCRIAEAFVSAGGQLFTRTRVDPADEPPGRVFALGRRRARSPWLGLKAHFRQLALHSELEVHLGEQAYVGLCSVEDGLVNVCGLFRRRPGIGSSKTSALIEYLKEAGLDSLAARLHRAGLEPASCSAVAGVDFSKPRPSDHRIVLGDTFAMIPPFTGNGMAMAFQSAECACAPLVAWAEDRASWTETVEHVNRGLRRRFRLRLASASLLHPFLLSPRRQPWIATAGRVGVLPLRALYHALH